jgi:hypothetical protein
VASLRTNSRKSLVKEGRRGALGNDRLGGFLRAGLSEGRVAARDCDEMQRALTTIVELNLMRQRETHYETVVIAMGHFQGS